MNNSDDLDSPLLGSRLPGERSPYNECIGNSSDSVLLEDPKAYKSRWRSIRVMYLTQFLAAFTFSITMSSIWPFLKVLSSTVNASFLGWVVASYSLGQLIASPFFGGWSNYRKSAKEPLAVSLVLGIFANIFYMYLQSLPSHREYFMIVSRGFIGISAGNVAVVRAYISGATTSKERTGSMANVSMCQVIGFIIGPVVQAAFVPIGYPGPAESVAFHFNMYTASGFISAIVSLINFMLLMAVFKEYHILDDVDNVQVQGDEEEGQDEINSIVGSNSMEVKDLKPDYVAIVSMNLFFFVTLFLFTNLETIATPVSMHMYAWTKSQATLYQGFIIGGGGVVALFVFAAIKPLVKRFNDRTLLLVGFIFCLFGFSVFISWGHVYPPRPEIHINNNSQPHSTGRPDDKHVGLLFQTDDNVQDAHRLHNMHDSHNEDNGLHTFHYPYNNNKSLLHQKDESLRREIRSSNKDTLMKSNSSVDVYNSLLKSPMSRQHPQHVQQNRRTSIEKIKNALIRKDNKAYTNTLLSRSRSGSGSSSTETLPLKLTSNEMTDSAKNKLPSRSISGSSSTETLPLELTSIENKMTTDSTSKFSRPNATGEGCPWSYVWCDYTPKIYLLQLLAGVLLVSIGYPVCQVFSYIIYSKILGPAPQGLWMGWLTASGSLARTVGPIYMSNMYHYYGPRVTYGSVAAFIFATIIFLLVIYRRIVPFSKNRSANSSPTFWEGIKQKLISS